MQYRFCAVCILVYMLCEKGGAMNILDAFGIFLAVVGIYYGVKYIIEYICSKALGGK